MSNTKTTTTATTTTAAPAALTMVQLQALAVGAFKGAKNIRGDIRRELLELLKANAASTLACEFVESMTGSPVIVTDKTVTVGVITALRAAIESALLSEGFNARADGTAYSPRGRMLQKALAALDDKLCLLELKARARAAAAKPITVTAKSVA